MEALLLCCFVACAAAIMLACCHFYSRVSHWPNFADFRLTVCCVSNMAAGQSVIQRDWREMFFASLKILLFQVCLFFPLFLNSRGENEKEK